MTKCKVEVSAKPLRKDSQIAMTKKQESMQINAINKKLNEFLISSLKNKNKMYGKCTVGISIYVGSNHVTHG